MFLFDEFLDVMTMINSRQLAYTDKKKTKLALIPLVDMINHSDKPVAEYYFDEERRGMVLEAIRDIPAGYEITISYGVGQVPLSNFVLFLAYGFVLENNDFDGSPLTLQIQENPIYRVNMESLDVSMRTQMFKVVNSLDEGMMQDFLGFARYVVSIKIETMKIYKEK